MSDNTEPAEEGGWVDVERPGYFGCNRDVKTAQYTSLYGSGGWRLVWRSVNPYTVTPTTVEFGFWDACRFWYEESYYKWFLNHPEELDFVCSFAECYDNDVSNVRSGTDYNHQESCSTHIQDIAVRRVLERLKRSFDKNATKLLQIRGSESEGERFNPGNIPFAWPQYIIQPSRAPRWAKVGSVEDFWQSNKILQRRVKP